MRKKWFYVVLLLALLFLNTNSFHAHAAAQPSKNSRIEGMLVVDVSNSMLESDPNKISNEAMKMFIDMASLQGDKIGAIAYADAVMREKALTKIRTEQDKADLKEFIDSLGKYPFTDLSTGVKEAIKVLDSSHEDGYFPLIVLLADGNNDLNKSKPKTVAQADKDLAAAVADAKAKGYPVYTIGLNADRTLNKDALSKIASSTNGKFFEARSAEQLPKILSEIFANHLKLKIVPVNQVTANGAFQDLTINVPNANVLEANISMISSKPVEVKLVDPTGKEQPIPSDKILYSKSRTYSMLKLLQPTEGNWTLKVKGVPKDKIDINLIFNYDLQLKLTPLTGQAYQSGDSVKVNAFFEENGQAISDPDIYKTMKASLFAKETATGKTEEIPLTAGAQGFEGQFKPGNSGTYELQAKAEGASFFRETQAQTITVQKAATAATAPVKPVKEDKPFPWMYVIIGVAAALLLGVLLFFLLRALKEKNRGFTGQMVLEIRNEDTGERTNPQYKKLKSYRGKLTLHQLLSLSPEFNETAQIIFKPMQGDTLLLTNASNCTIEKGGRAIDAKKGLQIKKNDRLRIVLKQVNKSIYLEYIS